MLILWTWWTTFVFMSRLKSDCLSICHDVIWHMSYVKWIMLILGTCWTTFVLMSMLKSEYLWLCHMLHVTCHIAHVTCHMSNAYVDPGDMLNNVCFHVYTQKWVFVIMSYVTYHISHVDPWDMRNNFCFHDYDQKLTV